MTEVVVGNAESEGEYNAHSQAMHSGAGQLLRQAREQQHMTVQALASALKVPVYKLQALEEERWDVLTDSVFARALALSICRLLRIPTEPVMAGMPKHEAAKLATNPEGINAPYKEKSLRSLMGSSSDSNAGSASKVATGLLIAVAVGAGLYFLPEWQGLTEDETASSTALTGDQAGEPVFMPPLGAESEASATQAVEANTAALPEGSASVTEPAVNAAGSSTAAPAVMVPAVPEAGVPAVTAPASAGGAVQPPVAGANGRVLRFKASGETWVQVSDGQQKVLMEKILKSGDVYEEAIAAHPLQVVVGNASATQLEIDGAAWDLTASAKNNVARFEVK